MFSKHDIRASFRNCEVVRMLDDAILPHTTKDLKDLYINILKLVYCQTPEQFQTAKSRANELIKYTYQPTEQQQRLNELYREIENNALPETEIKAAIRRALESNEIRDAIKEKTMSCCCIRLQETDNKTDNKTNNGNKTKYIVAAAVVGAIALIAIAGFFVYKSKSKKNSANLNQ